VISNNVEAYLSALQRIVGYNLLASPRITTLNHKPATILIGQKIGYETAVITTTGTVQQVNFIDTGTSLKITPHVSENGYVRMLIAPKVSEGHLENNIPQENTTETQCEVLVKDGQTIIIGGLIKEAETVTDTGVPILVGIPIIGAFFRNSDIVKSKRELLVFVTPHILTPDYLEGMAKEINTFQKRQKVEKKGLIH